MGTAALPAVLVLADGRFPTGGHVHSGGVEAAVLDGRVHDLSSLRRFVIGRLHTTGLVEASFAAAATSAVVAVVAGVTDRRGGGPAGAGAAAVAHALAPLDAEADARIPVPALRAASRRLGRQLARVAGRCWPCDAVTALAAVHPDGTHQSVALGAVCAAVGAGPREAALLALHHHAQAPVQAAVKLAGLDPFALAALAVELAPLLDDLAEEAVAASQGPAEDLPSSGAPLVDLDAARLEERTDRLFAT